MFRRTIAVAEKMLIAQSTFAAFGYTGFLPRFGQIRQNLISFGIVNDCATRHFYPQIFS